MVVANFYRESQDNYLIGFPAQGVWKLRFNSDWQGYNDDFRNHPSSDIDAEPGGQDSLPCHARLSIGPYSVLILFTMIDNAPCWRMPRINTDYLPELSSLLTEVAIYKNISTRLMFGLVLLK